MMMMGSATAGSQGPGDGERAGEQDGAVDAGRINYRSDENLVAKFLQEFKLEPSPHQFVYKYQDMLSEIANRKRNVLEVRLDDMVGANPAQDALVDRIMRNTLRYVDIFSKQADKLMPEPTDPDALRAAAEDVQENYINEVLRMHRVEQEQRNQRNNNGGGNNAQQQMIPLGNAAQDEDDDDMDGGDGADVDPRARLPASLLRRYEVVIVPPRKMEAGSLRKVLASEIGGLVRIRGIVVRVSDVKPVVQVATYQCDECGFETYQEVLGTEFMPKLECEVPVCKETRGSKKGQLHLQTRGSKFVKFQEIKIQEAPDQVPIGHIPRSMTVHAKGSCTRQCSPGDCVEVVGVFLPEKLSAFRQMRAGLIMNTYLDCMQIVRHKKTYAQLGDELSPEMEDEVDELADDENVYDKLARSIAPEIFGHEDVKKALLLQLVSGVTRRMNDGMSIRGDINVCLVGDPGVAKSQLLKHIASIAPRGVYTTGKGSSGVGLTAAVTRDKTTGDVALEGGALVLADMGICCIDEFDKMDDSDRTAIHEVMEQQTVSIAKAGITTTLNARTSILAAANPLYGRYNKRYAPAENINLPAALLSRFDLLFLLLDIPDMVQDSALAAHITHVHRHKRHPELDFEPVRPALLRAYISQARKVVPHVPEELANVIVEEYVSMRQQDAQDAREADSQTMLTARQLLSILRMAQALARLRFSQVVSQNDVQEAIRLVRASKISLEEDDGAAAAGAGNGQANGDLLGAIMRGIADYARAHRATTVRYGDIEPYVLAKGFTSEHLDACLREYEACNVFHVSADRNRITIVNAQETN
ncbi:DNA replication licensing factor, putative [Hondaea fermentalgiana]|uniref:DNA replication licensing factor MCM7 n=1 Tax=Hondaea fermentalgiana TaxID=2315210 RepID=A0A2R5GH90_9STRA|nr:DNA replication licensing factor, putative [Hondaea fermentalgiana]|eukprot:GBG28013.1 DNA replication licensing factor, putative [Hondaea fermentalgiana]